MVKIYFIFLAKFLNMEQQVKYFPVLCLKLIKIVLLVESLIRVMYWVVATILNCPFKPLNIKF